ncbi:MAG: DUF2461 family protein [Acidobacteriota bacterium]|nr:DUF2461 family protein [Acidobacteriota bacterium]
MGRRPHRPFLLERDSELACGGFSTEGLRFLTTLGSKDKAWFDANRAVYEREVVAPTKAFVTALGEVLVNRISSGIVAQPKADASISPINNDVRFAQARWPEPTPRHIHSGDFVACAPVHQWFVTHHP